MRAGGNLAQRALLPTGAERPENLALMRRLDELHLKHPVYGSRRLRALLRREGCVVNGKRLAGCRS